MRWVPPFGNLRIRGYSHLPVAYRSVSRPSSPSNAKASIKIMTESRYPSTPTGLDESIYKPSSAFKVEVVKVALGLISFAVVYVLLFVTAAALALLCAFAGISLVIAKPMLFTLILGAGLIGLGGMVFFFLIKFIFSRKKMDMSGFIEVFPDEQPQLFEFVRRLSEETGTQFPKKIFLSPEVNASAFYDSNFWSMIVPTRKNLQLGLGLVNALNLSEFKAVVAHEFGHFSQHSMKLGTFVYNVNKVIHNMLFDNEGYGKTIDAWANVSGYFALFARITVAIVSKIQWILQKMYGVVNKSYMGLSRQMEFHADAISAYVTGSDHLVTALCRIELSDVCYQQLFDFYEDLFVDEQVKPGNIYEHHAEIMRHFAIQNDIPMEESMMCVDMNARTRFNSSRLNIKDQWASHPSLPERASQLQQLAIHTDRFPESAWNLFQAPESLQRQMTEKVFEKVNYKKEPWIMEMPDFKVKLQEKIDSKLLHPVLRNFFGQREITQFEIQEVIASNSFSFSDDIQHVFSNDRVTVPMQIRSLQRDIETVHAISAKNSGVKTFDFDGVKYSVRDAEEVLSRLESDLKDAELRLIQLDKEAFTFFYNSAKARGESEVVVENYTTMFKAGDTYKKDLENFQKVFSYFNALFQGTLSPQLAYERKAELQKDAAVIKERLREMCRSSDYNDLVKSDEKELIKQFVTEEQSYFHAEDFSQSEHNLLYSALNMYIYLAKEHWYRLNKRVLDKLATHYIDTPSN